MKTIPLTKGAEALVDDEDFDYLNQWKWYLGNNGYAMRDPIAGKSIMMHHEILKPSKGLYTDHINQIKLDNRRLNLREATWKQNSFNKPVRKDSSTGYKGVEFKDDTPRKHPYAAYIKVNGKKKTLGHYETAEEAAKAYNKAALEYHGEFACVNDLGSI